jgi:2'-5' RNA ligase
VKNFEQGKSELNGNANLRLFFALWPNTTVRDALYELARKHQLECGGRVMRIETIHLTLMFLGETSPEKLPILLSAASAVNGKNFDLVLERFDIWQLNGIGYAAPVSTPDEITLLVERLRAHVAEAGLSFDPRTFVPHVTLLRNAKQLPKDRQIEPLLQWQVREFALVRSVLDGEGARYEVLGRWFLE